MKSDIFLLGALSGIVSKIGSVIRSVGHAWKFLQNTGVALVVGLLVVWFQVELLPWQRNSLAPDVCLIVMLSFGCWYVFPFVKDLKEGDDEPKHKELVFWLFLVTWLLPLVWLIFQSRTDFFRFEVSHKTQHRERYLQVYVRCSY